MSEKNKFKYDLGSVDSPASSSQPWPLTRISCGALKMTVPSSTSRGSELVWANAWALEFARYQGFPMGSHV